MMKFIILILVLTIFISCRFENVISNATSTNDLESDINLTTDDQNENENENEQATNDTNEVQDETTSVPTIPESYNNIEVGHWMLISKNTINDIDPANDPQLNPNYPAKPPWSLVSGLSGVIDVWNGGAFNPNYGLLGGYIVWGGGHTGYAGGEIYIFDLAKQLWERISGIGDYPCVIEEFGEYCDGTPVSSHSYDKLVYSEITNEFVVLSSSKNPIVGGYSMDYPHLYSFETKKWRRGAKSPNNIPTGSSSAYDKNRNVIWVLSSYSNGFSKYDPVIDEWTTYNPYHIDIDHLSEIDLDRDLFVTIDGRASHTVIVHDLANPENRGQVVTTTGLKSEPEGSKLGGFEWDPVRKVFVRWMGGTSIFILTPPDGNWKTENWVWSKIEASETNSFSTDPQNSNGTYSRWQYVPSLDSHIITNRTSGGVYLINLPK